MPQSQYREEFVKGLEKCTIVSTCDDPLFLKRNVHYFTTYEGTIESFILSCELFKSDCKVDEYGLHVILDFLPSLFEKKDFDSVSSVIITHYGHVLIRIQNIRKSMSGLIASLDIADLMDELSTNLTHSKFIDIIRELKKEDKKETTMAASTVKILKDIQLSISNTMKSNSKLIVPVVVMTLVVVALPHLHRFISRGIGKEYK